MTPSSHRLLAVDLGLRTGCALFAMDGTLIRYQSRKISGRPQLKSAIYRILKEWEPTILYLEGGGEVADLWSRQAEKMALPVMQVQATAWREDLLHPRERRKGVDAKRYATAMALRIIDWAKAPKPTSLRHDVAEAIVFGLWAVIREGWLTEIPAEIMNRK